MIFSSVFAGTTGFQRATDVVVDNLGRPTVVGLTEATVVGLTEAIDFPVTVGAYQTTNPAILSSSRS
jgi:hypothetical protein